MRGGETVLPLGSWSRAKLVVVIIRSWAKIEGATTPRTQVPFCESLVVLCTSLSQVVSQPRPVEPDLIRPGESPHPAGRVHSVCSVSLAFRVDKTLLSNLT